MGSGAKAQPGEGGKAVSFGSKEGVLASAISLLKLKRKQVMQGEFGRKLGKK